MNFLDSIDGSNVGFTNTVRAQGTASGLAVREVGGSALFAFNLSNRQVVSSVSYVPEPAAWVMMLAGFGAMGTAMRRRPSRAAAVQAG